MGRIRSFTRDDIPAAAALRRKTFRSSRRHGPGALERYFERVFFESPWVTDEYPSLVFEQPDGKLGGFLGIIPRPMRFGDETVTAAVSTQMMVTSEVGGAAAALLLKRFFAGPQDVVIADAANDQVRPLWERLGGTTDFLRSLYWTQPLRPRRFALSRGSRSFVSRAARYALRPVYGLADEVFGRHGRPPGTCERASAEVMAEIIEELCGRRGWLRPSYDGPSMAWLLDEIRDGRGLADVEGRVVRGPDGDLVGWFVRGLWPDRVALVLQAAAKDDRWEDLLHHVTYDAWSSGAVAVTGRLEPGLLSWVGHERLRLSRRGPWTLLHSRRPEVLDAISRGRALLSRMEGEWWTSF